MSNVRGLCRSVSATSIVEGDKNLMGEEVEMVEMVGEK